MSSLPGTCVALTCPFTASQGLWAHCRCGLAGVGRCSTRLLGRELCALPAPHLRAAQRWRAPRATTTSSGFMPLLALSSPCLGFASMHVEPRFTGASRLARSVRGRPHLRKWANLWARATGRRGFPCDTGFPLRGCSHCRRPSGRMGPLSDSPPSHLTCA